MESGVKPLRTSGLVAGVVVERGYREWVEAVEERWQA
jgi:hypothetical protein